MILVGIDPGVTTGFAIANGGILTDVRSMGIVAAMDEIRALCSGSVDPVGVLFEDARLRRWFGRKGREALQGAGSVKRDCTVWSEFLARHEIPYRAVAPGNNFTKLSARQFATITGWRGTTNEHGRDAAMLVHGRRALP